MPRLPLCGPDELRVELAGIGRDLVRLAEVTPITTDAAERVDERREILRRWQHDLEEQLAELDAPTFVPVPYNEWPPGY